MILASHIIISGLLASKTQNYFLAALIGLISHYILDAIPHWDYLSEEFKLKANGNPGFIKSKKFWQEIIKVVADIVIGLLLLFIFLKPSSLINIIPAVIGLFFGVLPDPINLLYWMTGWKIIKWNSDVQNFMHYSIHPKIKQGFCSGILIQIVTIALVFAATFYL